MERGCGAIKGEIVLKEDVLIVTWVRVEYWVNRNIIDEYKNCMGRIKQVKKDKIEKINSKRTTSKISCDINNFKMDKLEKNEYKRDVIYRR